jgi:hypothetical protein
MHALLSRFVPQLAQPMPQRRLRRSAKPADDLSLACGWFDSSHELQQGLCMCELPVSELPLADLPWLVLPPPERCAAA